MKTKTFPAEIKAFGETDGEPPGTFEAVIASFGTVDRHGDRILDTAFDKSLSTWRESGDPIPVILSHGFGSRPGGDIMNVIGHADPNDIEAIPGRGLKVKGQIDHLDTNQVAAHTHRLMQQRVLREFSFGYDIPTGGEAKAKDGAYDLSEISIHELGPCLKGVNENTELVSIKSEIEAREREAEESPEERVVRLRGELEKAELDVAPPVEVVEVKAWDGSAANYTDAEYAKACVLDRAIGDSSYQDASAKQRYGLPVATPGESYASNPDVGGVHAAAQRIGQVDASAAAKQTAARRLVRAYGAIGEADSVPDSVTSLAKAADIEVSTAELERKNVADYELAQVERYIRDQESGLVLSEEQVLLAREEKMERAKAMEAEERRTVALEEHKAKTRDVDEYAMRIRMIRLGGS